MTQVSLSRHLFWYSLLNSNRFVWSLAIVFSLTIHYFLFFHKNKQYNALPDMVIQETITHVRFSSVTPPPITVVEPQIEIPKPEPVIPPEPTPVEEKIVAEKKPEPVIKKKVKPKPKPKPKPKKKPKPKPKPKPVKKVQKVKVKPTPAAQPVAHNTIPPVKEVKISPVQSKADQRLIEQTRKSYQALLMRHIEVHKHYPRVARKRKIEGKIQVSFTLLANGDIKNLMINGKRSILKKATKNAIDYALPMPQPPKNLSLPMDIKFYMNYFLK